MLRAEDGAPVVHHNRDSKVVVWIWDSEHFNINVGIFESDIGTQFERFSIRVLVREANAFNRINEFEGTAIHDRNFRSIELDQRIVYLASV